MKELFLNPRLMIPLMVLALYAASLSFDFAYDDTIQIIYNPQVTSSSSLKSLTVSFKEPTPPGNLYRPLTTASYAANFLISGLNPGFFHLTNVLIYILVCYLVFCVALKLFSNKETALVTSLIFAVHPLHTEAVANITGRAELLSALFLLPCFLLAHSACSSGRRISLKALTSGILFLLAAFSKESALAAAPLVLAFPFVCSNRRVESIKFFALIPILTALMGGAGVYLSLRYGILGPNVLLRTDNLIWPENPLFNMPLAQRVIPSIKILGDYLLLMLIPLHQSIDYSLMPDEFMAQVYSLSGACSILLVLLSLIFILSSRNLPARYAAIWIFLSFALTINLILPIGTIMGERLAFFPSVGGAMLTAYLLTSLPRRSAFILTPAYCGILTMLCVLRIPTWSDNGTLFTDSLSDAPRSPKAHYNYAVYALTQQNDLTTAEQHFRKALEIHPTYVLAARGLADVLLKQGSYGRLEFWYRRLLELTPDDKEVRKNLDKLVEFKEQNLRRPEQ